MIPALPAALLPFAEPRSCRCSARVSSGTGRFSLRLPLCCRLPSLEAAAVLPGFFWNGTAALASIPYYYNIAKFLYGKEALQNYYNIAKFLYGKEALQKNSIAIFLPCNAGVSLFLLFSAPHFKSVTPDSSEIASRRKTSRSQRVSPIPPRRSPADAVRAETFRRSAVCTVEQLSEEKRRRFTPCRHFGAGSLTDRHVSGARRFCMRQFVHLQDSSWRSLFRNSNFSAQCRIVSASRQIRTVPHVLSDRPTYPLPVILPIPLLLNPGNEVAALTDAFIHQRPSVSGASAPTTQPIL